MELKKLSSIFIVGVFIASCTFPALNPEINPVPQLSIHDIQGAGHISPLNGKEVKDIKGIVMAVRNDGFYMQEAAPDKLDSTSEGILVLTQKTPMVKPGDEAWVDGVVEEMIPGGAATANLSITIIKDPKFNIKGSQKSLPAPVVIGEGGRIPPSTVIDSDRMAGFNPDRDGLDFFESMESMLVQVNQAVVVGPTNNYKEIVVVTDNGKHAELLSARGALVVRQNDFNPERIIIDDLFFPIPDAKIGDRLEKSISGVLDYSFGNFKLQPLSRISIQSNDLPSQIAPPAKPEEISVATLNVNNLDPMDGQPRFDNFARTIAKNLQSPDIIVLEEIQDNNGAIDNGITDAAQTYQLLINSIIAQGGPPYAWIDIAPENNRDGGEPGGNIRVGFLYRKDKDIYLSKGLPGDYNSPTEILPNGHELSLNPGRIDPKNSAFTESRKPLAASFVIKGIPLIVVGLHMNSKGGDSPLFGRFQPANLVSEDQRNRQAAVLRGCLDRIMSADPNVGVIVAGDLNDFQFSAPVKKIIGSDFIDLVSTLPENERYGYIYDGNAQSLDHILVSKKIAANLTLFHNLHINSEYPSSKRSSDHDPSLVRFVFTNP